MKSFIFLVSLMTGFATAFAQAPPPPPQEPPPAGHRPPAPADAPPASPGDVPPPAKAYHPKKVRPSKTSPKPTPGEINSSM